MKISRPIHLFLSGSSIELGHLNHLGGCCCHATREGLLNKSLGDPNHLWNILVPRPKKLHLGATFLSLVHHIVGVVVDTPSVGAWVEEPHMSIANSHGRACHTQGNCEQTSHMVP